MWSRGKGCHSGQGTGLRRECALHTAVRITGIAFYISKMSLVARWIGRVGHSKRDCPCSTSWVQPLTRPQTTRFRASRVAFHWSQVARLDCCESRFAAELVPTVDRSTANRRSINCALVRLVMGREDCLVGDSCTHHRSFRPLKVSRCVPPTTITASEKCPGQLLQIKRASFNGGRSPLPPNGRTMPCSCGTLRLP